MAFYPTHHYRQVLCLDGFWNFAFLGDSCDLETFPFADLECTEVMAVPQAFDAVPGYQGRRGTAVYQTSFRVERGREAQLRFGGLGLWALVFVDGQRLADWSRPYSPQRVDLPASDQELRKLTVVVDNRLDPDRVPLVAPHYDFYLYGGIWRSVWLHQWDGDYHLERVQIRSTDIEGGTAEVELHLGGGVPPKVDCLVSIDRDSGTATERAFRGLSVVNGIARFNVGVPDFKTWSPGQPALHKLWFRLVEGTRVIDDLEERIGFRQVGVAGGRITLNGEPLKLKGFCRHEGHPEFGPALPQALVASDLAILEDLGCNFVRGAHYCQDQRFLSLCDERGLLVFEEALGWGASEEQFRRPSFADQQEDQTRRMIRESFNHPSVILWGFLNEGRSGDPAFRDLYQRLANLVREEDPTRLVTYATNAPFEDLNLDLVDVISTNLYPGWYTTKEEVRPLEEVGDLLRAVREDLRSRGLGDKPQILSEIGAAALYGWRDPLDGPYSEQYQSDLLELACRCALTWEDLAGISIWQLYDVRTYASARANGRPRTFNNKGVLDEYRRPKQAYRTVRRLFRGDE